MAIITRAQAKKAYWRAMGAGRPGRKPTLLTLSQKIEFLRLIELLRREHGIARALTEAAQATGMSTSLLKRLYYANRGVLRQWNEHAAIWREAGDQLRAFVEAFPDVLKHEHVFDPREVARWAADFDRRPFSAERTIGAAIAARLQEHGILPTE